LNDNAAKRPTPHALLSNWFAQKLLKREVRLCLQVVDDLQVCFIQIRVVHCNYGSMLDAAITENGVCGNEHDVNVSAIRAQRHSNIVGSEARGHAWNGVAWNGVAWNGVAWNGVAWNGVAWNGIS